MLYGFLAFLRDITAPDYWKYKGLPYGCRHCELLGICRRKKDEWGGSVITAVCSLMRSTKDCRKAVGTASI